MSFIIWKEWHMFFIICQECHMLFISLKDCHMLFIISKDSHRFLSSMLFIIYQEFHVLFIIYQECHMLFINIIHYPLSINLAYYLQFGKIYFSFVIRPLLFWEALRDKGQQFRQLELIFCYC